MAKVKQQAEEIENVTEVAAPRAQSASEFIENNQKLVLGIIGALIIGFLGWFLYKNFWVGTRQEEALQMMWKAEDQFSRDSFNLALNNPGAGNKGFLAIANDYSGTAAGEAAAYYAGVCYLNMGQYDKAIQMLDECSPSGDVLPIMKYGALADAYSEKKDYDKALSYYNDAVEAGENELLTAFNLYKYGRLCEKQKKIDEAKKAYMQIKEKYFSSPYGREVEKFLARLDGVGK